MEVESCSFLHVHKQGIGADAFFSHPSVKRSQGDKIRKRNDWINWVLPPSNNQFANTSTQPPATPNSDHLAARFQSVGLNGVADRSSTVVPSLREVYTY